MNPDQTFELEETPKRPYRAPGLMELGAVDELTHTTDSISATSDGGGTFPDVYAS